MGTIRAVKTTDRAVGKNIRIRMVCWLIQFLLLALVAAPPLQAARVRWQDSPYTHFSREEKLPDLLRDFCSSQRLSCVISEKVTGSVSGRFNQLPGPFFEFITAAYGLTWYYDSSVLFIYRADEIESQMITLDYLPVENFKRSLEEIEISDKRFPLKSVDQAGIIYVAGPKRFVDLVTQTAAILDKKAASVARAEAAREVIKVFPLQYAWADDQTFILMNREVVFPGVATALRNILAGKPTPGLLTGKQEKQLALTVEKLKGKGLIAVGRQPEETRRPAAIVKENDKYKEEAAPAPQAFIHADTRLNAVIVRDTQDKIPLYEAVIPVLDTPVGLVQIQASIMDVNTNKLRELGVNWRLHIDDNKGEPTRYEGGFNADREFNFDSPSLVLPQGFSLTTIIGDAEDFFMARINVLEEKGNARIVARPSVLTLDNLEAQLEDTTTFHVRVAGDQEVDLFPVTTGIVLKVTPHIIAEEGERKIKLAVKIEDGSVLTTSVDRIPDIQTSVINTQAVVRENESLLIGGSIQNEETEVVQKVPVLGDIPLMGYLFKNKIKESKKMERLFLITPRIIDHDHYPTAPESNTGESSYQDTSDRRKVVEESTKTGADPYRGY